MVESFNPQFEYDGLPVACAAATSIVLGAVAILIVGRPAWILPIGFFAGVVAAMVGEFSGVPANNGLLGVVISLFPIYGYAVIYRLSVTPAAGGDAAFFSVVFAVLDIVVYGPLMLLAAYLGGIIADSVRRRMAAPIGY
ncbi:hypothetical protein AArcSl_0910 [Halalkaliarchaeum desulfuricum]|uniref:Uncharacterized protein n=1 Tax=Halalkaliarchaeum desulfuricum TaxID=2055893 RepID=A0A343THH6_9EURY|nr:hypothetical protein [Halalkaliarchaeum desulfuricum]AUX08548.1 hypothetical protein AArcSl_0910 [Halalkaliarchaeum desulfuricum]